MRSFFVALLLGLVLVACGQPYGITQHVVMMDPEDILDDFVSTEFTTYVSTSSSELVVEYADAYILQQNYGVTTTDLTARRSYINTTSISVRNDDQRILRQLTFVEPTFSLVGIEHEVTGELIWLTFESYYWLSQLDPTQGWSDIVSEYQYTVAETEDTISFTFDIDVSRQNAFVEKILASYADQDVTFFMTTFTFDRFGNLLSVANSYEALVDPELLFLQHDANNSLAKVRYTDLVEYNSINEPVSITIPDEALDAVNI